MLEARGHEVSIAGSPPDVPGLAWEEVEARTDLGAWAERGGFDLVHVHHGWPLAARAARGIPARIPLVMTLHGSEVFDRLPWTEHVARYAALAAPSADLAARARADLVERGAAREVRVLPNPLPESLAWGALPLADRLRVLHVSTGRTVKRRELVVRACRRLATRLPGTRIELELVGPRDVPPEGTANFLVSSVGWTPPARVFERSVDVLLLASRYESFSLVAQEALARGIPVVAPRVGGLVDRVTEPACGELVEACGADPVELLASALERVAKRRFDVDARRRVALAVRERFGWPALGEVWETWLHRALATSDDRLPRPQRHLSAARRGS